MVMAGRAPADDSVTPPGALDAPEVNAAPDYSNYSHHELTEIGARWDELGDAEQLALLQEVKLRMARQQGGEGVLRIRSARRYGRIVRRSDGRVLRIETQVLRVQPVKPSPGLRERSFGVGFERRSAQRGDSGGVEEGRSGPPPESTEPSDRRATTPIPVLRVKDKSG